MRPLREFPFLAVSEEVRSRKSSSTVGIFPLDTVNRGTVRNKITGSPLASDTVAEPVIVNSSYTGTG